MLLFMNELTPDEFSSFETFLYSPYFNRIRNLKLLFDYIKPIYPDIKPVNISYEAISKNVFKEKVINKVKIRKLFSDFSKLVESYLLQIEMENDKEHKRRQRSK